MDKTIAINTLVAAAILGGGLYVYHQRVVAPGQRFGVIDVAEIWRVKEKQFAEAMAGAAAGPEQAKAMQIAGEFSQRLPGALEELARECACLVLARSAVVVQGGHAVDLTPALMAKVGL